MSFQSWIRIDQIFLEEGFQRQSYHEEYIHGPMWEDRILQRVDQSSDNGTNSRLCNAMQSPDYDDNSEYRKHCSKIAIFW